MKDYNLKGMYNVLKTGARALAFAGILGAAGTSIDSKVALAQEGQVYVGPTKSSNPTSESITQLIDKIKNKGNYIISAVEFLGVRRNSEHKPHTIRKISIISDGDCDDKIDLEIFLTDVKLAESDRPSSYYLGHEIPKVKYDNNGLKMLYNWMFTPKDGERPVDKKGISIYSPDGNDYSFSVYDKWLKWPSTVQRDRSQKIFDSLNPEEEILKQIISANDTPSMKLVGEPKIKAVKINRCSVS